MEITEVRVKLVNVKNDKLRAFCSITVDNDFVIRDLKVIEGAKGAFVAMPSRKLTERCARCGGKNHYRARFCNDCGGRLAGDRGARAEVGSQKLHTDIAHPINSRCREVIQKRVLEVYQVEVQKSAEPGYKPMEFEVFDEDSLVEESGVEVDRAAPAVVGEGLDSPGGGLGSGNGGPAEEAAQAGESRDFAPRQPRMDSGPEPHGRPREAIPRGGMPSRPPQEQGRGEDRRGREGGGRGEGGGQFRRGFRGQREGGREGGGERRPNGGGRGPERPGESRREGLERDRAPRERRPEGETTVIPERDALLADRQPAPGPSGLPVPPPAREPVRKEPDPEPEDNFGAGLFN